MAEPIWNERVDGIEAMRQTPTARDAGEGAMVRLGAPWTDSQVASLNAFQECRTFHPFTCGWCSERLTATRDGWDCPRCHSWLQTWAMLFMADWSWKMKHDASQEADAGKP